MSTENLTSPGNATSPAGLPPKQGLYDPQFEHDACGVGFVVNIKGNKSHEIVRQGLTVLLNLNHRGACGCEANTGDGAGILIQTPHAFFQAVCPDAGIDLPAESQYGVGMLFLPQNPEDRRKCEEAFAKVVAEEGQVLLGWRTIPTDNSSLGATAKSAEPFMRQVFIGRNPSCGDSQAFERKLYTIRKRATNMIRFGANGCASFYVASLSSRTLVYKGMLMPEQLENYYPDLTHPRMDTALALVHSRFSTNTFPSWERAIPTVTWRTTARSTRCAATSTGCTPARPCSNPSCSAMT